jgi:hypothetical protein
MKNFGRGFIYGLNLQDAISPVSQKTIMFHDENMLILLIIASLVGGSIGLL